MEFGSDFHIFDYPKGGKSLLEVYPYSNIYASGRQALLDLAIARGWKRLWVPSYFCEESLECIRRAGIQLRKYKCTPYSEPDSIIEEFQTETSDGLLIVDYFGLFGERHFTNIGCEVVEDHTHNLIGEWALNSSTDWCIASLRKALPIPDGGLLWSPKNHKLPDPPHVSQVTVDVMDGRFRAMRLKEQYLHGNHIEKTEFLNLFRKTEETFDSLEISRISDISFQIVKDIDIFTWYDLKRENWHFLKENLEMGDYVEILLPENSEDTPFSIILKFKSAEIRDKVRRNLISRAVYPAILWNIEDSCDESAKHFGDTMLSIHCDGRYSLDDMKILSQRINESFN